MSVPREHSRNDDAIDLDRDSVPDCVAKYRQRHLVGSSLWQLLGLPRPVDGYLCPLIPAEDVDSARDYVRRPTSDGVLVPALNLTEWDYVMLREAKADRQTFEVSTGSLTNDSSWPDLISVAAVFEVDVVDGVVVETRYYGLDWL